MRYASWVLKFSKGYGTGPEAKVAASGERMEAFLADGPVEDGATIYGYVSDDADLSGLAAWNVAELTVAEATTALQAIAPDLVLAEGGRFQMPVPVAE